MRVGIVGSRKFPELELVRQTVRRFEPDTIIISGGAKGVDLTATTTATSCGLETQEYLPNTIGCVKRYDFTKAYYARNQQIVDSIDRLYAFTEKDTGGTWDTIKRARKRNIPVHIIHPSQHIPVPKKQHISKEIGKGPFHLKRVGFGSAAMHLKKYITGVEWADYLNSKQDHPEACAAHMLPDFIRFFRDYPSGHIDAITQAPKSIRNITAVHPMDIVCAALTQELGVPYVPMFKAWDKPHRGRCLITPELTCLPAIDSYCGKVVYVFDDISTTNLTLMAAMDTMRSHGIHAHAVCWVRY